MIRNAGIGWNGKEIVVDQYGFDGENAPIIGGSALCALEDRNPEIGEKAVFKLLDAIEAYISTLKRDLDKPLFSLSLVEILLPLVESKEVI